jgi:SRSO17 transposase
MGLRAAEETGSRFVAFVDGLVSVMGHADRAGPLRDYCTGLVMPCERKSVEPMAAVTAPANVGAQHQSLLHFRRRGALVGRESLGQSTRDGAAGNRAP